MFNTFREDYRSIILFVFFFPKREGTSPPGCLVNGSPRYEIDLTTEQFCTD